MHRRRPAKLPDVCRDPPAREVSLIAASRVAPPNFGGVTIGSSPERGVVDGYQRVWSYPDMHVVDRSVVSANLYVNRIGEWKTWRYVARLARRGHVRPVTQQKCAPVGARLIVVPSCRTQLSAFRNFPACMPAFRHIRIRRVIHCTHVATIRPGARGCPHGGDP